ncbi:cation transporter [Rhodocaloribacter litoris]|uniref:cation transporter n=1 Tax=Rhodocaloribacter litoris TaxID=2558931 RepID=UPI001421C8AD|nr:cation transporter [Rhodocaloribacter litoris]QXD13786.1 cation transporter [Rhodocaloribacter litoris]
MLRTTYHIEKMDCAAEEQMVRMRLEGMDGVERLVFDLPARRLTVYHRREAAGITAALERLGLGAIQVGTTEAVDDPLEATSDDEKRPLAVALAINAAFFVGEITAGFLAGSMGLVADSLDMLADALVYALSLAAVGGPMLRKKRLARYSGYLQFGLAVFGLVEVARRFVMGEGVPDVTTMIVVAALALVGNVATLLVLTRARRGEAHVEASWIFTSNDIKVNGLVIVAGLLVWATSSRLPDLLAGALIFLIVARGARQILALANGKNHA